MGINKHVAVLLFIAQQYRTGSAKQIRIPHLTFMGDLEQADGNVSCWKLPGDTIPIDIKHVRGTFTAM